MNFSNDKDGLLVVQDDNNRQVFNRDASIDIPGWSRLDPIDDRFVNINEVTGIAQTRN